MRTAMHAIRLMGDMKDYRYIRNINLHQKQQEKNSTASETSMISGNTQPNVARKDTREGLVNTHEPTFLEGSGYSKSQDLPNEGESSDVSSDEPITGEEDHLNKSTASIASLAEMFDEIRNTRYLRIRPRMSSGDLDYDDDDNDCSIPYAGYRVPMIIVGHTKVVFMDDETKKH
jgi:hypothetical protein